MAQRATEHRHTYAHRATARLRNLRGGLAYLAAIITILLAWQIGTLLLGPVLLPGIPRAVARGAKLLGDAKYISGIGASFMRLGAGYAIGCLLATVLGLTAGLSRTLASYLRALVSILQAVPPITWVPFLLILFGFGNVPIIIVVFLASFFPMAIAVLNGAEGVSRTHLEVARVMGASRAQLLTKVYAPETFPSVITGAQVAFGNAWRNLIASEMVSGTAIGLGWSIRFAGEVADMAGLLFGIVIVGFSAAMIDRFVLEGLKRWVLRWRNATGGEAA